MLLILVTLTLIFKCSWCIFIINRETAFQLYFNGYIRISVHNDIKPICSSQIPFLTVAVTWLKYCWYGVQSINPLLTQKTILCTFVQVINNWTQLVYLSIQTYNLTWITTRRTGLPRADTGKNRFSIFFAKR